MSLDLLSELNWLAVIAGGVIYFALGAVWFMPAVLGRPWQRSMGWDPAAEPPAMNPVTYAIPLAGYLLAAVATGLVAAATGSDTIGEGIALGLVLGVGFAATVTATTAVFDPHKPGPAAWFAITAGYHVVGILIVAILVSAWQ